MRTILYNKVTRVYFQGVADWTKEIAQAFDFKWPERVVRFVLAAGLHVSDMEIVFAFDDERYNIELPIDERFGIKLESRREPELPDRVWADLPVLVNASHLQTRSVRASTSESNA